MHSRCRFWARGRRKLKISVLVQKPEMDPVEDEVPYTPHLSRQRARTTSTPLSSTPLCPSISKNCNEVAQPLSSEERVPTARGWAQVCAICLDQLDPDCDGAAESSATKQSRSQRPLRTRTNKRAHTRAPHSPHAAISIHLLNCAAQLSKEGQPRFHAAIAFTSGACRLALRVVPQTSDVSVPRDALRCRSAGLARMTDAHFVAATCRMVLLRRFAHCVVNAVRIPSTFRFCFFRAGSVDPSIRRSSAQSINRTSCLPGMGTT
jgi:hypothetical protein